ncbi:unnamed protein product [Blepharisma stoltei]|uniref:Receptor ligand binding region domain-containing protein n=1 Tax=Blepharisma stoltei TaxID=1481888 RepID=A0AAU9JJ49_9CILI|nr:unnamed protein product [Blepharisma stoltei]
MINSLILWLALASSQFINVPILYSRFTPSKFKEFILSSYNCPNLNFPKCNSNYDIFYIPIEIEQAQDIENLGSSIDFELLYDCTFSLSITAQLNRYAIIGGFIQLVYGYDPKSLRDNIYFSAYSFSQFRDSIVSLIKYFDWKRATAIYSPELISYDFQSNADVDIAFQTTIPNSTPYETIYLIISKQVKPLGVRVIIIATNCETTLLIQRAIVEADMHTKGYAFIFLHQSAWTAYLDGSILISELNNYIAHSMEDHAGRLVSIATSFFLMMANIDRTQGVYSGYTFNNYEKRNIIWTTMLWVFNIKNNQTNLVGSVIDNKIDIWADVTFPGDSSAIPDNSRIKLPMSFEGGISNPDGSLYFENALSQFGSVFAVNEINTESNILSNFEISAFNISDCGASFFDYDYAYNCFKAHSYDIGYFHIAPATSEMAQGTFWVFKDLNISTPILGVQSSSALSDIVYYPQYFRLTYPSIYNGATVALFLSFLGISKCSFLHSNSSWTIDFKKQFIMHAKYYNIEILNHKQIIPIGYDGTGLEIVKEIVQLQTRFVVLEVAEPELYSVIENFYDLGMRKGDIYLIIGDISLNSSELDPKFINKDLYQKRSEIMEGLVHVTFLSYYKEFGKKIREKFMAAHGYADDYMCLFYDAVYLGAYTFDQMITNGISLNTQTIEEWARKVKFTGCSGNIKVASYGNDASTIAVGVYNLIQKENKWETVLCGIYTPSLPVLYQTLESLSWLVDGKIPSDMIRTGWSCPFKASETQSFIYGYLIMLFIAIIPFGITIYYLYKNYESILSKQFPMLEAKEKENWLDILSDTLIAVESLQYMALGPGFSEILPQVSQLAKLAILDFRDWDWNIWEEIEMAAALSFVWFFLSLQRIFSVGSDSKIISATISSEIWKCLFPIIGEFLFTPITLFLFLTFQCTDSTEDSFKESFHSQDCYVFCWQDKHVYYVAISSVALFVYLPCFLYYRLIWDDETVYSTFHFWQQPIHAFYKTIFQILLISLKTIVYQSSEEIFHVSCINFIAIFIFVSLFSQSYNYQRASLWFIAFLFSCIWLWICCGFANINNLLAQYLIGIGWITIWVIGIIYQAKYLPSFLESSIKGDYITKLFRFQLSVKSPLEAGIEASAKYSCIENSSNVDVSSSLISAR